jgi:hypothetical protein
MAIRVTETPRNENDVDMVVCYRVMDLPIPCRPATIKQCSVCRERIWVADSSPEKPPLFCIPCATSAIEADGGEPTIIITRNTLMTAGDATIEAISSFFPTKKRPGSCPAK